MPGHPESPALFAQGFLAMLPLWAGAIPSGIAYGVAAQAIGLGVAETQLMSLVVFSAAAQVSAVSLLDTDAPGLLLVGTAMALNAQLLLLGLTVGRQVRLSWVERFVTAWFLTDGAFGVTAARGPLRIPVLLGAGMSMFLAWNLGTSLGMAGGQALPDAQRASLDFVVPLSFLAVLVPLVRTRATALVVLAACLVTPMLALFVPGGVAVLGAGVLGSAAGAWWLRHASQATR